MKPQTPQEKFDAAFVELKKKHLPSFRKASVMFLIILVLSLGFGSIYILQKSL